MKKPHYAVYKTKHILNIHKHADGGWFWGKYTAFPYVGCEWGCNYCYWRDKKYNPHKSSRDPKVLEFNDPFSEYIKVKENAPELFKKALQKQPLDLIYLDNYQPIDAKYLYTRKMLQVCLDLKFPVFINEKSPMLLRDLDLLKKIKKQNYLNVGWSIITTKDDQTRQIFEPKAPSVSARFEAMEKLAKAGIMTGTVLMPVLPFIYDNEENIKAVIKETRARGGEYVLEGGLTLWGYSKDHFYQSLEKYDPKLIKKYNRLYQSKELIAKHQNMVHQWVLQYCRRYRLTPYIPRPVDFFPQAIRINKQIAAKLYLQARELQLSSQGGYREWAYRKAAWALDELEDGVDKIYQKKGIKGLTQIPSIGQKLAFKIKKELA